MQSKRKTDSNTKEILINFMKTTSIRGLPRIINSESKAWCMVHTLFFLAGLGLTTYMIQQTLTDYFQFQVSTKASISRYGDNLYFPDITLCNINPHSDQFVGQLRDVLIEALNKANVTTTGIENKSIFDIWNIVEQNGKKTWLEDIINSMTFVHTSLTRQQQDISGHKKEDFIRDCKLMAWYSQEEQPCKMDQIVLYRDLQNLNCFTFQLRTQRDEIQMRKTRGVSFYLFLAPTKRFVFPNIPKNYPSSRGAIVYTHEPDTMPSKWRHFTVSPGFETRVSITVVHSINQPAPYGDCETRFDDIQSGDHKFSYDYDTCVAKCAQKTIRKTCGCLWEEAPPFDDSPYCTNITLPMETLRNNMECLKRASAEWKSNLDTGHKPCYYCKDKCNEYKYLNSMSQSVWPDVSTHLAQYTQYIQDITAYKDFYTEYEYLLHVNETNLSMAEKYAKLRGYNGIKDSLIKLDVMLSSKDVLTYEQIKTWTPVSVCASLGATLIFGIGFTYFAVAEIFECMFYIIKCCCRKHRRDIKGNQIKLETVDHLEHNR